ncbi:MAG: sulfotransferase domain-containing protein [Planctomycetota bacterium]|nr:sulfotransferase domain-containing protein [Planctomycetota bacterium]
MICWIASYPRSGNSLLQGKLWTYFRVRTIDEYMPMPPTPETVAKGQVFPFPFSAYQEVDPPAMSACPEWYYIKTHHPPREQEQPAIHIVRDGRDALVSYAYMALASNGKTTPKPKEFRSMLECLILEKRSPFKTWSESVEAWLGRPNTVLVRFERLLEHSKEELERVVSVLDAGLEFRDDGEEMEFSYLRSKAPHHYRRGIVGSWKDEMPADLEELFWTHNGATMERLGYPR